MRPISFSGRGANYVFENQGSSYRADRERYAGFGPQPGDTVVRPSATTEISAGGPNEWFSR
jgi:hypothetical protein